AVTGIADPDRLLRNDTGRAGVPLSLTKPLGIGMLNSRHKNTGAVSAEAVETMTRLNDVAARDALAAGAVCATDVTGFGLLGHLFKMARASDVSAVIDSAAVPYLEGARQALADGFVSGGTRRNLDWVRPHLAADVDEDELLLLADAQTSGGLLVAGEVPGAPVIGELVPAAEAAVTVRGGARRRRTAGRRAGARTRPAGRRGGGGRSARRRRPTPRSAGRCRGSPRCTRRSPRRRWTGRRCRSPRPPGPAAPPRWRAPRTPRR